MIIRSQNKKRIVNLENIIEIVCNKGCEIMAYFVSDSCCIEIIGEYSTEEKAVKVLDMIEAMYENISIHAMSGQVANTVFQMPQDSEV